MATGRFTALTFGWVGVHLTRGTAGIFALQRFAIAVAIGLPLGVAAGRWTWTGFVSSIGVVPVTAGSLTALLVGLVSLIALGIGLTAVPAVVAAHAPTSDALRTE